MPRVGRNSQTVSSRPGTIGAAICLWAVCAGAQAPAAPELLDLGDGENGFACLAARGELVVLAKPGVGAVVLALAEFPGSERVGTIQGSEARFSIPGLRMPEQVITSKVTYSDPVPLWGMAVRDLDLGGRPGCFALERPESSDADGLEALVRRKASECTAAPAP